jgi:hypothetical protein
VRAWESVKLAVTRALVVRCCTRVDNYKGVVASRGVRALCEGKTLKEVPRNGCGMK